MNHSFPLNLRIEATAIFFLMKLFPDQRYMLEGLRKANVEKIIDYLKNQLRQEGREEGRQISIDRVDNLSEKDFFEKYFKQQMPVVFNQQAINWRATQAWSLDFFKDRYQDRTYNIVQWMTEREFTPGMKRSDEVTYRITGKEFFETIQAGKKVYLRGCPILEEEPELQNDLDLNWLKRMRQCFFGVAYQSFISSGKVFAPIHNESTSFFFIVIEGQKKWRMFKASDFPIINPEQERIPYNLSGLNLNHIDEENYPGVKYLDCYKCDLKKGDILFVPAWMWHFVETPIPSWAISYKFSSFRSFLSSLTFVFDRLLIAKPNILDTLYYSFFRSDMGKRDKYNLIPKLFVKK